MDQMQSIGEMLQVVRRRLAILILVTVLGTLATLVYVMSRPSLYETSAKIVIESQQISDALVRSTVNLSAAARLQLIEQRLLARDNLIGMIKKLGLFADAPGLTMARKVELLRTATRIQSITSETQGPNPGGLFAFVITVQLGDAEQAAAVANELVDSAIAENLQVRAERTHDTLAYFDAEDRRVGLALAAMDSEITAFKKANEDALPENLASRRDALTRVQDASNVIDQRILSLEEKQADLEAVLAGERPVRLNEASALAPEESELRRLEMELAQKRKVLAPSHPEVQRLERQVAAVSALTAPNADGTAGPDDGPVGERRAAIERQISQLSDQIRQLQDRKQTMVLDRQELERSIRRTPEVEVALNALERRHTELQEQYSDVARRRAEARTGEQLEANNQSERFQILETALVPEEPVGPNRKKLAVFGSGASAGIAIGLALLLEAMNPVLRTSAQMERQLGLRPVVAIPYVAAPGETWRRRSRRLATVVLIGLAVGVALMVIDRYTGSLEPIGRKITEKLGHLPVAARPHS